MRSETLATRPSNVPRWSLLGSIMVAVAVGCSGTAVEDGTGGSVGSDSSTGGTAQATPCAGMDGQTECENASGCRILQAQGLVADASCLASISIFAGCTEVGCPGTPVVAKDPEGTEWYFSDGCIPDGWATARTVGLLELCADGPEAEMLEQQKAETLQLANESRSCGDQSDCGALAIGSKACGGPWEYVPYSVTDPAAAEVEEAAANLAQAEHDFNAKYQIGSDCALVLEPGVTCADGLCELTSER